MKENVSPVIIIAVAVIALIALVGMGYWFLGRTPETPRPDPSRFTGGMSAPPQSGAMPTQR